jgi:tetratricopeptide (TPR) repeat protein
MGSLLIGKGEGEEGLKLLRGLAEEGPDEALNWMALGHGARELGRSEESVEHFGRAAEVARRRSERAMAWLAIATLHRDAAEYDEAALAWERAFEADPQTAPGPVWIYLMYIEADEYVKAREYLAREENRFLSNFYAGWISWKEGNPAGARRVWQMVTTWEPGEQAIEQQCWAEACLRTGQAGRVPPAIDGYLEEHAGTASLFLLLGVARAVIGELETAEAILGDVVARMRSPRRPELKIGAERWELVEAVVEDEEARDRLREYFEVE